MTSYVPVPPTDEPVMLSRDVLLLLALVDMTTAGSRVLRALLALHDPETGAADISQNEMCALLGATKPTVNRGFKELKAAGIAWRIEGTQGKYQLHPVLTNGKMASPQAVPELKAQAPETFTEARRRRFARQVANLGLSA
ncbi:helix-turn-helix domain-containing protein [Streptomyces sp. NPDC048606]|uniref:helix-turn-helix domain-containing protein n=1 Tax=Streptomyces sp. NPDC048606 TaxID=3154726 RepID=UPI003437B4F2